MTIEQARREAQHQLTGFSDAADLDAHRLLLFILGQFELAYLITHSMDELSSTQETHFFDGVKERLNGTPLAYLVGEAEFYGRRFQVTPQVLIPRPDTEHVIDTAKTVIRSLVKQYNRSVIVADVGTGSGCVAITLCLEMPTEIDTMIATDISPAAVEMAKKNAGRYGLADQIVWLSGDMLEPLANLKVDLIVSNPPYVPTAELDQAKTIETQGLAFEPRVALDGGSDGLEYVRRISQSGIPAVVETLQGQVETFNLPPEQSTPR